MATGTRILIVGTADTKADELRFMQHCIRAAGGEAAIMDVGVLGQPAFAPEYPNTAVAAAAHTTLAAIAALGDENAAMTKMAEGAVNLALDLYRRGEVHGLLALGGTMGTDLALDVTAALPLGMPKFIVSTVAFSHLVPAERLAPDLMMILWAGGLHGLNSVCRSILSQAAGAVMGACRAVVRPDGARPRVAVSSLGKSCLAYMTRLNPELERRGFEPVVFHCTGMGGRAMEALIEQGAFVAVFDFALCELSNLLQGSVVNAGPTRLTAAARRGIPQLLAPGASDMIDVQSWAPLPAGYAGRPYHAHNRLIGSVTATADERRELARFIAARANAATGPTAFLLPRRGLHAWDLPGEALHEPAAHAAFMDEFRCSLAAPVEVHDLDLHINDPQFVAAALAIFDRWLAEGRIPRPA
ncbi:MAG: Tm-1-like ATP-binding domain-containing protein [Steroidobacteraceae bacterium]